MILIFNTGSTSIKAKLYEIHNKQIINVSSFAVSSISSKKKSNFSKAVQKIVISNKLDKKNILKVGYRIVHGGDEGKNNSLIDNKVERLIAKYNYLSPNHNPYALVVIRQSKKLFKKAKHYAFFDTAYFSLMPKSNKTYPLFPFSNNNIEIKKYGFHGLSHQYMYQKLADNKKAITIHLGAGSSMSAINKGKPLDTTMGVTPLGGLVMLTRAGDIDPGIVLEMVKKYGHKRSLEILSKKSGLLSITNKTNSMLDILYQAFGYIDEDLSLLSKNLPTDQDSTVLANVAINRFIRSIQKYICEYYLLLNGCDYLIFSGKIGYGSKKIRSLVVKDIKFLDIKNIEIVETDEESLMATMLYK